MPSDALVALTDSLVGGMLLSKLVLLAALAGSGWGAAALTRQLGAGGVAPYAAATLYLWNPFVAERLVLGHWARC